MDVRGERLQPERALPQQPRRHVHRHRRDRRLRLQPGRQAAGGHGRRDRRLRPQRHDGHLQDELRRRHLDALRQHRRRASARIARSRAASASTRAGSAGASASSTSTTTAGSTLPRERPRLSRGRAAQDRGRLQQRKVVYRNRGDGRFEDVTERLGPPVTTPKAGRGAAFGDSTTTATSTSSSTTCTTRPTLSPGVSAAANTGCAAAGGTQSNRSAIGARVRVVTAGGVTQVARCAAAAATTRRTTCACTSAWARRRRDRRVEVRWPNGREEVWTDVAIEPDRDAEEGHGADRPGTRPNQAMTG